uniref:FHOD1/3-like FH3 domain-containing protein n=1 Tax=Seriola lalandi dorsalis TaxID=1841481 RepID=A0A3B4YPX3_SERLL
MLYVDGMNGLISHNETVQWLYTLVGSKFRLVVKTSNATLLIKAVNVVDHVSSVISVCCLSWASLCCVFSCVSLSTFSPSCLPTSSLSSVQPLDPSSHPREEEEEEEEGGEEEDEDEEEEEDEDVDEDEADDESHPVIESSRQGAHRYFRPTGFPRVT